jgi:parvulin-like peptidyl-prolyl isomerase
MKRHQSAVRAASRITTPALRALTLAAALGLCASFAPATQAATKPAAKPSAAQAAAPDGASAPLPANSIARVNSVVITQDQLDQAVRAANTPDSPALRATLKNQLIARELFRQAAEKAHYDTRPQVVAAVEQAKSAAMTAAYLHDQLKPTPVTDADLKARYDALVATLGENEFKPSAIAVKDQATAQTVIDQLKKGGDFAQLAKQYSQGPGAAQGGALNWVSFKTPIQPGNTQNWPQPLAEALVKLPQGGVTSAPVQVGDIYWVLRVDQKRPTQIPEYDKIKDTLRRQLEQVALEKATAQVVVELVKNAHIQQQ